MTYCDQEMPLPNSPSLTTSTPTSACRLARRWFRIDSGRIRLPTWVVRILSVLRCMGPSSRSLWCDRYQVATGLQTQLTPCAVPTFGGGQGSQTTTPGPENCHPKPFLNAAPVTLGALRAGHCPAPWDTM